MLKLGNKKWEEYVSEAQRMIENGNADDMVPRTYWKWFGGGPISASRFASLAGEGGDDDFFSSDLPDARLEEIWGDRAWEQTPVLLLYGDRDQYVPDFVDKAAMLKKWSEIHQSKVHGRIAQMSRFEVLTHANHELLEGRAQREMCSLVLEFLGKLSNKAANSVL